MIFKRSTLGNTSTWGVTWGYVPGMMNGNQDRQPPVAPVRVWPRGGCVPAGHPRGHGEGRGSTQPRARDKITELPCSRWARWLGRAGRAAGLGGHRERTALPRAHPSPVRIAGSHTDQALGWPVRSSRGARVSQAGPAPAGPPWGNWGGRTATNIGGWPTQATLPLTMIG